MTEEQPTVWINSDVAADGSYVLTVSAGEDQSRTLNRDEAMAYAFTLLDAVGAAVYDAAVLAQLTERSKMPRQLAIAFVAADLRPERPERDDKPTAPLTFTPSVAAADHRPYIVVSVNGERVGQWEIPDAREHALHILEGVVAVDLDAGYYRKLIGIEIAPNKARGMVQDVANYRSRWASSDITGS